jgi:hypothetical protein
MRPQTSIRAALLLFMLVCVPNGGAAQSGGTFQLEQSVIAPGGSAAGGTFSLQYVIGEPAVGKGISGGHFVLSDGFWQFPQLAPTAAAVSITGQVLTATGEPVSHAYVTLILSTGVARDALTNQFGRFRFDDVSVGRTYIVTVRHKSYQFAPQVVSVEDEIADMNFIALN